MSKRNLNRLATLTLLITLILVAFMGRVFYLQVIQHDFFLKKSTVQLKKLINLFSHRGSIFDRNRQPLATTQTSYAVFVAPDELDNKWDAAHLLAPVLNMSEKELRRTLYETKSSFLWIKRQATSQEYNAMMELELKGVGAIKQEKRVYPHDSLASHVLGFVGVDNQGLGGLEYKYDTLLKGTPGKLILESDPRGRQLLSGRREFTAPNDGHHIVTTLDEYIQYITEKYLKEGIEANNAKKGQVIVMNPQNGHILSMATYPSYDANSWQSETFETLKNSTVVDVYEPGSIFKLITIASALEEEVVTPGMIIDVPEKLQVYDRTITEAHDREEGDTNLKTVTEIVEKSLNVGTSLIAEKLGKQRFYKYIKSYGFGEKTHIQLPGESKGLLRSPKSWSGVDYAMLSFGQGIAVTSVQMAAAASAIINGGLYIPPKIVDYTANASFTTRKSPKPTTKKRVISTNTSQQVKSMMENVVIQGTGQTAAISGYRIGGKTGTAQKAKENQRGYDPKNYIASFMGFFPFEKPEYLILVMVDSPEKSIWGSSVAAPIFKNIAQDIIHYYHIPPDQKSDSYDQS